MRYLIGIDAGTTAFKGAMFDETGIMKATASARCPLISLGGAVVECKPEDYESALRSVISGLFKLSGVSPDKVAGIAIDSQGETLIFAGKDGRPLSNAIVWLDGRASEEARFISERYDKKTIYETTGQPEAAPGWPACKLLWLKNNQPDIFNATHKFLLLEDYLIHQLTGRYVTERSLVSSTIYYDIRKGVWWDEMLDLIGIDPSKLPEIFDSGKSTGKVSAEAAATYGLSQNTQVVTGALDQLAAMLGSGSTEPGMVCESTGTCLSVCAPLHSIPPYSEMQMAPCHAGTDSDSFYQIYWAQTAGAVLEWYRGNFYPELKGRKGAFSVIDDEAASAPPGSEGLVMLPHLSGTAYPDFDPEASGVFYGIRLFHERKHFSRAIMESVAYMLRQFIEAGEASGLEASEIRSIGGGSNSALWNSIKADVTGKAVVTLKNTEAACLGAAILAGVGTGIFESISEAAGRLSKTALRFEPDLKNRDIYDKGYDTFNSLYEKLKNTSGK